MTADGGAEGRAATGQAATGQAVTGQAVTGQAQDWLAAADAAPEGRPEEAFGWPRRAFLAAVLLALGLLFGGGVFTSFSDRPGAVAAGLVAGLALGVLLWLICVPLLVRPALHGGRAGSRATLVAVLPVLALLGAFRYLARADDEAMGHAVSGAWWGLCAGMMLANVATIGWIRFRYRAARPG